MGQEIVFFVVIENIRIPIFRSIVFSECVLMRMVEIYEHSKPLEYLKIFVLSTEFPDILAQRLTQL